jgi:KDO2-lipid IV(A) lauroyltransferase
MVGYARRLGKPMHYEMGLETLIEPATMDPALKNVTELTQWYTSVLEKIIRVAPEQYWWLHRRWRDDRGPKKRGTKNPLAQKTSKHSSDSSSQNVVISNNEAA